MVHKERYVALTFNLYGFFTIDFFLIQTSYKTRKKS